MSERRPKSSVAMRMIPFLILALMLIECIPNARYWSSDRFMIGQRAFDRGEENNAFLEWKPMAVTGDCDAQAKLGLLYFLGAGVLQSYKEAEQWWIKSADQGHPLAFAFLATMAGHNTLHAGTFVRELVLDCRAGCGAERNLVLFYKYYGLIAASPFELVEGTRDGSALVLKQLKVRHPCLRA